MLLHRLGGPTRLILTVSDGKEFGGQHDLCKDDITTLTPMDSADIEVVQLAESSLAEIRVCDLGNAASAKVNNAGDDGPCLREQR